MTARSRVFSVVAIATIVAGAAILGRPAPGAAASSTKNPICSRIGNGIEVSAGAQGYCNPPAGSVNGSPTATSPRTTSASIANVNAANPSEDVSPSGTRAYGQAEVSTAAVGPYVIEAWNDSTGFFTGCTTAGANMDKEELTGLGFSYNGGASFTDLGGLPNDCTTNWRYEGDPAVEGFSSGNTAYFYITSLYINISTGQSDLAMDACTASGPSLTCTAPIIVATGAAGVPNVSGADFLDKDFSAIDPGRNRLYTSYTRFTGSNAMQPGGGNGVIELAVCDLTNPAAPTCYPGTSTTAYLVVQPADPNCENEGAYPAVDRASGDVYVAWEFNWATNLFSSACQSAATHVAERVAFVPFSCLTVPTASMCTITQASVPITSMDGAFIPGYNRFPMNDFPRIAVSDSHNTVSIVWNDARTHVLGDILLQSFSLGSSLTPVQGSPTKVNSKGAAHFLPALRYPNASGNLVVSWYERGSGNSAVTSYVAANNVNPRGASTSSETTITNVTTNWDNTSSDIVPDYGDYTDNYVQPNTADPDAGTGPTTNDDSNVYYAWSDGRSGDPQPYNAHTAIS